MVATQPYYYVIIDIQGSVSLFLFGWEMSQDVCLGLLAGDEPTAGVVQQNFGGDDLSVL